MSEPSGNAAWRALSDKPGKLQRDRLEERAMEKAKPLDAIEMQRLAIRNMRKGGTGRRGLPREVVSRMYSDYLRLGSLEKVGLLYRRSRQAMYDILRSHGCRLNERKISARVIHNGVAYTPTKGGYFRPTTGERTRPLHHAIWEDRTGRKIPPGWQVSFKNGDSSDLRFSNLFCAPIVEVTLHHYRRRFPDRANFSREELSSFWRQHNREFMRARRGCRRAVTTLRPQSQQTIQPTI